MTISPTTLGWDDGWAESLATLEDPALLPARVVAVHRGRVAVRGPGIDQLVPVGGSLQARAASAVALPAVGDWVAVRDGAVRAVLERRTVLSRADEAGGGEALAANVDLVAIVTSLNHDLNLRRLERFVALARAGGIEPLIVASKGDLASDPLAEAATLSRHAGAGEVIVLSALDGWGINALRARLRPGTTSALVGMSGVGKSTLVNLLLGAEVQRTLEVREADDRGRHATTHRELFVLEDGAMLIDTPGLRLPRLESPEGLDEAFSDVHALAAGCRFADCRHDGEPGCEVARAIADGTLPPERVRHLRKLEREGLTAQERRARHRAFQRRYRKDVAARTRRR